MFDAGVADAIVRSGKRIVVTGAGGWLGLATLDSLIDALGSRFVDRVVAFGSAPRELVLRDGTIVQQRPLAELRLLPPEPTWLLHFAFLTKDRAETMAEAEYRVANADIRNTILSALDLIGVEAIFVASSGAAYKAHDPSTTSSMRLYGELKLQDEQVFAAWSERLGKRAVIARIFNVTGPYINKHQAYALASFILDGLAGHRIEVRASRRVVRAYVPISELMSLVFAELGASATGVSRFDTGGQPLELGDVAAVVAAHFASVAVQREPIVDLHSDVYHGDAAAYAALLAQYTIAAMPLEVQVAKTIDYLRAGQ